MDCKATALPKPNGIYAVVRTDERERVLMELLFMAQAKYAWASAVATRMHSYDVEIRARVTLRKRLGREPSVAEVYRAYDTERKLSVESLEEKMGMLQWMHFQNCCQGYVSSLALSVAHHLSACIPGRCSSSCSASRSSCLRSQS